MTQSERTEIERAVPSGVVLSFVTHEDSRFVRLMAHPCPLLTSEDRCAVYAVRPYNCRRYACGREDVTAEPFDASPVPARFYADRDFRRQAVRIERKAQRWADAHGWGA